MWKFNTKEAFPDTYDKSYKSMMDFQKIMREKSDNACVLLMKILYFTAFCEIVLVIRNPFHRKRKFEIMN